MWAEFEVYKVKDKFKMTEIMEKLVRTMKDVSVWELYISYEKHFGDIISVRKLYKRAVDFSKEDKDYLSTLWVQWEKM